jgi:hypothetical protein
MTWVSAGGVVSSVPAEATRRYDRLKFAEVQLADGAQRLRGRAVLKVLRQIIQPGGELSLGFYETGDVIGPTAGPAAMICWTAHADDWHTGCSCGAVAGLAFSVGHGGFTDRFARHGFQSQALRHDTWAGEDASIAVLEAPTVIAGLDDVAMVG